MTNARISVGVNPGLIDITQTPHTGRQLTHNQRGKEGIGLLARPNHPTLYVAIAFATASPSGVSTSTSQLTRVLPRRSTRPTPISSVARAGARNWIAIEVVTPRNDVAASTPAHAAAMTVTSAS